MIERKLKRLLLGEYTNGASVSELASRYGMTEQAVRQSLEESGVIFEKKVTETSVKHRIGALDRKLARSRMELYREKQRREKAEKRVYRLESEFRRRGIPVP